MILIDASNSSATFQFAQMIKENKLASLVGKTTGGNQRGINGSAFFFVTLPNSRIEVDLPLVGNFVGAERPTGVSIPFLEIPDAGINPDFPAMSVWKTSSKAKTPSYRSRGRCSRIRNSNASVILQFIEMISTQSA